MENDGLVLLALLFLSFEVNLSELIRSSHQPRPHRFTSLLASFLVTAGVGYFIWREMKLNAAQQLVVDCRTLAKIFCGIIRSFTFLSIEHEILASY